MSFYEVFSRYYDAIFPAKEGQLSFFAKHFEAHGVQRVFDVACGTGNYTLAFANWGVTATGSDLSSGMIEQAQEKALAQGLRAEFRVEDMQDLASPVEPFDALICIGNSLAHLLSADSVEKALCGFSDQLRPGGLAILQLVNYERILAERPPGLPPIVNEEEGVTLERFYDYRADGLIDFRTVLIVDDRDGQEYHNVVPLNPLRQPELDAILRECGFVGIDYFGDFKGIPYEPASPALVVVARKATGTK